MQVITRNKQRKIGSIIGMGGNVLQGDVYQDGTTVTGKVHIQNNVKQITAFIIENKSAGKIIISNLLGVKEIEVTKGFVSYCRDQEFLILKLLDKLYPALFGAERPENFIPVTSDDDREIKMGCQLYGTTFCQECPFEC
jgi:hypothetical protein